MGLNWLIKNLSVTVTDENEQPENLDTLAALKVMENQSAGSFAGEFNATDQDANTILSYSLVSGQGMRATDSFRSDVTGSLRTAEVLNYESNATRSIRVRVADNRDAWTEAIFIVAGDLNDRPVNLSVTNGLNITENQPVGSWSASSRQATKTQTRPLVYELVNGSRRF